MSCIIVVPARMGSTRFPGKPLIDLEGKAMVHHVVLAARASGVADRVIIATPDPEILDYAARHGLEAVPSDAGHPSGTDRIAALAEELEAQGAGAAVYVNVQGDEPLIRPESIRACAQPLLDDARVLMASVCALCPEDQVEDPAVVKVVRGISGDALYFSRHAIPFPRNPRSSPVTKHLGIYAYRRSILSDFRTWSQTPLELAESLEQLRFLEHGVPIRMAVVEDAEIAVDTPAQAEAVRALMRSRSGRV